jgi:hypothetical protein
VTAITKEQMFTPTVSTSGRDLPYGLGWFTQEYQGTRLIWHYGYWSPSISALFMKLPEERLTFIVLANTDGLSRPFQLGNGDIMTSLVALTFYKEFVLVPRNDQPLPVIDWSGDDSTVLKQIHLVKDEAVHDLLLKEFYSRRMVVSSLVPVQEQARLLAQKRAKARELAKSLDPKSLDAYVGEYEIEQLGITLSVSRNQDGLYIQQSGEEPGELLPLSATRFFIVVGIDIYEVEFTFNKTNQVTGLVLTVSGQSFSAKRR